MDKATGGWGPPVEVRTSFEGRWVDGFEVAGQVEAGDGALAYRLRRLSDGAILPSLFPSEDVRVRQPPPSARG